MIGVVLKSVREAAGSTEIRRSRALTAHPKQKNGGNPRFPQKRIAGSAENRGSRRNLREAFAGSAGSTVFRHFLPGATQAEIVREGGYPPLGGYPSRARLRRPFNERTEDEVSEGGRGEDFYISVSYQPHGFAVSIGGIWVNWTDDEPDILAFDDLATAADAMRLVAGLFDRDQPGATPERIAALLQAIGDWANWWRIPDRSSSDVEERAKLTATLRYDVLKRDGFQCRACGAKPESGAHLHIDHVRPVSRGGRTELANLQALCSLCNLGKGVR